MDGFPNVPTNHYDELRSEIKSGDILFCSGSSLFATMIQGATNSVWSHVAFVIRLDIIDRVMVMESVESIGVRTVPLSNYVRNYNTTGKGYPGRLMLARHQDFQEKNITHLSQKAVDLFGYPYNTNEIVRIAARIGMKAFGFKPGSHEIAQQREFICSEYAYICFKSVGITIDYDPAGFIAPANFAKSTKIKPLRFIATENG